MVASFFYILHVFQVREAVEQSYAESLSLYRGITVGGALPYMGRNETAHFNEFFT